MGAYLSAPVTDKFSSDVANEFMSVGSSSMQGWRRSQEVSLSTFSSLLVLPLPRSHYEEKERRVP